MRVSIFLLLNLNGAHLSCGGPRPKPNQSCDYYDDESFSESSVEIDVAGTLENIATALIREVDDSEPIETRNKHLVNVIHIDVSDDDVSTTPNQSHVVEYVQKPVLGTAVKENTPCQKLLIFLTAIGILFGLINFVIAVLQFMQGTRHSYYFKPRSVATSELQQCVE